MLILTNCQSENNLKELVGIELVRGGLQTIHFSSGSEDHSVCQAVGLLDKLANYVCMRLMYEHERDNWRCSSVI